MIRAIRGLAVAGLLVAVALAAWMTQTSAGGARFLLLPVMAATGTLLSFSAGVLALAQTVQRKQRLWTAALIAALFLNGYFALVFSRVWYMLAPLALIPAWWLNFVPLGALPMVNVISNVAALVALGYTFRAVRSVSQASPAVEERESHEISIAPMAMPARLRILTVACGLALLVGGLLALVALFLPWEVTYYPRDFSIPDSPPDPARSMFHITPMGGVAAVFANARMNQSPSGFGAGLACGMVFLAPPLALVALGLLVCATRRWRATGVAVAAACIGLAVALSVAWLYAHPFLDDSFSWHRPDVGVAAVALGYGCALIAGGAGRVFRLDRQPLPS